MNFNQRDMGESAVAGPLTEEAANGCILHVTRLVRSSMQTRVDATHRFLLNGNRCHLPSIGQTHLANTVTSSRRKLGSALFAKTVPCPNALCKRLAGL